MENQDPIKAETAPSLPDVVASAEADAPSRVHLSPDQAQQILTDGEATATAVPMWTDNIEYTRVSADEAKLREWQDIATAPKDGTRILLWNRSKSGVVAGTQTFIEYAVVGVYVVHQDGWYGGGNRLRPTHWMPIPSPPPQEAK